ncbi:phycobiliprotein lyase [Calothrix sp. UHCC 0171]|uniref:phycobiliprotein lyase n=1 Tax=Calothrix sp. UHCC 0171 TaxID=3110245 RepID=UPI002B1FDC2C|nr:phycobiliprotein lyase [Calothrix sp. UHCC 0171]MEA5569865.1 phycobiliprotein lyase [Calothrix sp. UHCC 0171]
MTTPVQIAQYDLESLVESFFRETEGNWRSERRYYTLKSGEVEEVISDIAIAFLEKGSTELVQLAQKHELADTSALVCGSQVSWISNYSKPGRKPVTGSTVFGVRENILFRDRGFATSKPVAAEYFMRELKTMHLHTEYGGSTYEEEIKLIGSNYRTRQTIISRAGEEIMIGQYLERRVMSS